MLKALMIYALLMKYCISLIASSVLLCICLKMMTSELIVSLRSYVSLQIHFYEVCLWLLWCTVILQIHVHYERDFMLIFAMIYLIICMNFLSYQLISRIHISIISYIWLQRCCNDMIRLLQISICLHRSWIDLIILFLFWFLQSLSMIRLNRSDYEIQRLLN